MTNIGVVNVGVLPNPEATISRIARSASAHSHVLVNFKWTDPKYEGAEILVLTELREQGFLALPMLVKNQYAVTAVKTETDRAFSNLSKPELTVPAVREYVHSHYTNKKKVKRVN